MLGVPVWKQRYNSCAFIWHLHTCWLYLGVAQVYLCILDVSFVSFPCLLQNINKKVFNFSLKKKPKKLRECEGQVSIYHELCIHYYAMLALVTSLTLHCKGRTFPSLLNELLTLTA